MRAYRVEGIVIKRTNVGEADRILTVITRDHGKIQIKAKSVRKITSKRASHIELLNLVILELHKGLSLHILTEAQQLETFQGIKENLKKTGIAYHLCEIIDALCPVNQENRHVFFLFKTLLYKLVEQEEIYHLVHMFEIEMLRDLGYLDHRQSALPKPSLFIEEIIEKKLKTRQILPQLL